MELIDTSPVEALKSSPVFASLPESGLTKLARLARRESFRTRSLVCASGKHCDALRFVQAGGMEVQLVRRDGRARNLAPVAPGEWATWLGCFHRAPMMHDLWASAGTRCLAFPCKAIREQAELNPGVYREAIQLIGERMRGLMTVLLTIGAGADERTLAGYILTAYRRAGGGDTVRLTQEQIAMLGFGTRQRAARLLRRLEEIGLVSANYGRIEIRDPSRLRRYVAEGIAG